MYKFTKQLQNWSGLANVLPGQFCRACISQLMPIFELSSYIDQLIHSMLYSQRKLLSLEFSEEEVSTFNSIIICDVTSHDHIRTLLTSLHFYKQQCIYNSIHTINSIGYKNRDSWCRIVFVIVQLECTFQRGRLIGKLTQEQR